MVLINCSTSYLVLILLPYQGVGLPFTSNIGIGTVLLSMKLLTDGNLDGDDDDDDDSLVLLYNLYTQGAPVQYPNGKTSASEGN